LAFPQQVDPRRCNFAVVRVERRRSSRRCFGRPAPRRERHEFLALLHFALERLERQAGIKLILAVALVVASAAPVLAEGFPNVYMTR